MTKDNALFAINNFGVQEEYQLVRAGRTHEAHQIRCARNDMLYALIESVKFFKKRLDDMIEYTVDESGDRHYNPFHFVADEYTRQLLIEFREDINA